MFITQKYTKRNKHKLNVFFFTFLFEGETQDSMLMQIHEMQLDHDPDIAFILHNNINRPI